MTAENRHDDPGEMISELAHDLKTPIAAIKGFAELLRVRDDDATRQEASVQILAGATRLSDAVDELLETFLVDPQLAAGLARARAKGARAE